MKSKVIYQDKYVHIDMFEDGKYRVTLFKEDCHWNGDMMFTKDGIIYNDLEEKYVIKDTFLTKEI